jgi:hypothetical protein|nr:MAG TPA: hypothetical protein [Caudoviricetes sp.]
MVGGCNLEEIKLIVEEAEPEVKENETAENVQKKTTETQLNEINSKLDILLARVGGTEE